MAIFDWIAALIVISYFSNMASIIHRASFYHVVPGRKATESEPKVPCRRTKFYFTYSVDEATGETKVLSQPSTRRHPIPTPEQLEVRQAKRQEILNTYDGSTMHRACFQLGHRIHYFAYTFDYKTAVLQVGHCIESFYVKDAYGRDTRLARRPSSNELRYRRLSATVKRQDAPQMCQTAAHLSEFEIGYRHFATAEHRLEMYDDNVYQLSLPVPSISEDRRLPSRNRIERYYDWTLTHRDVMNWSVLLPRIALAHIRHNLEPIESEEAPQPLLQASPEPKISDSDEESPPPPPASPSSVFLIGEVVC